MRALAALLQATLALATLCSAQASLRWSELPPLPDTPGFGGPFVGVLDTALVVAGGAGLLVAGAAALIVAPLLLFGLGIWILLRLLRPQPTAIATRG